MHRLKLQVSHTTVTSNQQQASPYKSYQAQFSDKGQVMLEEYFDAQGQPTTTHAYSYNEEGFLIEERKRPADGECMHFQYEYDDDGRMTRRVRKKEDKVMMTTVVSFDDLRETEITTGPRGLMITKIDRLFDQDGKLTELIEYQENEMPLYTQKFSYDLDSNLTMAEYFDEQNELMELHIRDFDEEGRVVRFEKQNNEGHLLDQEFYTYGPEGMLLELKKLDQRQVFTYNDFGLERLVETYNQDNLLVSSREIEYNEIGLVETETITEPLASTVTLVANQYEFYSVDEPLEE